MVKGHTAFDCEQCPLSDCYPEHPGCRLDMKNDRRAYQREYMRSYRRVTIKGVKLNRDDIETLKRFFEDRGETPEEEIAKILEAHAQRIRERMEKS